jgi:hypothetical protein
MNCSKCNRPALPGVDYAGKNYCEKHFLELMERRIRKHLRTGGELDPKKEYFLFDDSSSEFTLTKYFLEKIFNKRLILREIKSISGKSSRRIIFPSNLDEQALLFLDQFLLNKKNKKEEKIIPLEVLQQREVELLCGILGMNFKKRVKRNLLQKLEEKHPGTMFSLFQSRQNLREN